MASRTLKEGKEYQVHHPGGWSSTQITSYAELFFTFLKRNYMQINKQIIAKSPICTWLPILPGSEEKNLC